MIDIRVCDIHGLQHGNLRQATERLVFMNLEQPNEPPTVIELCDRCKTELDEFLNTRFMLDKMKRRFEPPEEREGEVALDAAAAGER